MEVSERFMNLDFEQWPKYDKYTTASNNIINNNNNIKTSNIKTSRHSENINDIIERRKIGGSLNNSKTQMRLKVWQ
jgi:hypothetical protein